MRDWLRREWVEGELAGEPQHLKRGNLETPNASIKWFSVLPSIGLVCHCVRLLREEEERIKALPLKKEQ